MDKNARKAIRFLEDNLEANGCAATNNLIDGDEITYEQFALYRQVVYDIVITAWSLVPEGFVLVPVEPTEEMVRVGTIHHANPAGLARDIYAAMLAARPQGVR